MRFGKSFPGILVAVVLLALMTACSGSDDSGDTAAPAASEDAAAAAPAGSAPAAGSAVIAEVGKPAPDFALTVYENPNFTKDQVVRLSDLKGKPVVINFWFPSCYECGDLMWLIKGSYDKHKDDVHYVAVQVSADSKSGWDPGGSNAEAGQAYVTDKNLEFVVGADPDRSIATAYDVQAYPTTYFLDKDLTLVTKQTFLRARQIEQNIESAMK